MPENFPSDDFDTVSSGPDSGVRVLSCTCWSLTAELLQQPRRDYHWIVVIKASNNGRSCDQHAVCGSVWDNDVMVRLRKVQRLNINGQQEVQHLHTWCWMESIRSVAWAFLVLDGIDQKRCVGFLECCFLAQAKSSVIFGSGNWGEPLHHKCQPYKGKMSPQSYGLLSCCFYFTSNVATSFSKCNQSSC